MLVVVGAIASVFAASAVVDGLRAAGFVVSGWIAAGLAAPFGFATETVAAAKSTVSDRVAIRKIRLFTRRDFCRFKSERQPMKP
jgi:hypothetical protein